MKNEIINAINKLLQDKWLQKTVNMRGYGHNARPVQSTLGDRVVTSIDFSFHDADISGEDDYYTVPTYSVYMTTQTLKKKEKSTYKVELEDL